MSTDTDDDPERIDDDQLTLTELPSDESKTTRDVPLVGILVRRDQHIRTTLTYARDPLGRSDLTSERIDHIVDTYDTRGSGIGAHTTPADAVEKTRPADVPHYVVPSLNVVSDSWRDVHDFASALTETGTAVHVVDPGITITEGSGELDVLRAVADEERDDALNAAARRLQAREPDVWDGGRPPLGHTVESGSLVPDDDYDEVCAALDAVDSGEETLYWAAQVTDHSRYALKQALKHRRELYGLDPVSEE